MPPKPSTTATLGHRKVTTVCGKLGWLGTYFDRFFTQNFPSRLQQELSGAYIMNFNLNAWQKQLLSTKQVIIRV